ncbi:Crp/Fnr family transcriptional regulator [Halarcobacter bivalviorum]|uniref:Crp/Fnr family transcriptional regulator n=1 Tax=Halarcobacter bivalviorum TaxID=663364 RepID=A0AAX2AAU2_9BACT|nr:Crp/Fnr family transcriptional regulator [Halarcobacter bivalviorum]AXH13594.1 putative nitrosative stress-response regulator NssR, Crp/Fnr family [Halarcobacter bivalviorum]RXK09801.1 Crp/Fnr family transcriptional regulator [Halarcobacter bivalviorum]
MSKLKDFYLFSGLSAKDLELLDSISFEKKYIKDELIFYKGDEPKYLLFLLTGCVKIYRHDFKDNEVTIHNIKGPSFIAELANYEKISYPANCRSEMDSTIVYIDYEKFEKYFLEKNEFLLIFIKSLTKKIKALEMFISSNMIEDIDAKIAKFIYDNKDEISNLKQIKIAELLNIRQETLSRKLAKLKKDGVLHDKKGKIELKSEKKLKELF